MSKLERLIAELCPDGVEYVKVGNIAKVLRGKRLTKSDLVENGAYAVFHGGLEPLGYYQHSNRKADSVMVINVGASAGTVGYCNKYFWSSDGCFCIEHNDAVIQRYLYFILSNNEHWLMSRVRKAGIPTLDAKVIEDFPIPLPPIPVQEEIVRILDNFTELTAELTARKKQYEHYRDGLLTFGDEVEWKALAEVLKIKNGKDYKQFEEGKIPVYGSGGIMTYIDTFAFDKASVLIPRKGSVDKLYYVDTPFWTVDTIFYTDIYTDVIIPKYIYYYLQKEHLEQYNTAGGVPSLTQAVLNKIPVPVPPLPEQQRIVDILDRFDTLCNDISSGLPAEIKARQQQYEYYRDKLLAFKKKEV